MEQHEKPAQESIGLLGRVVIISPPGFQSTSQSNHRFHYVCGSRPAVVAKTTVMIDSTHAPWMSGDFGRQGFEGYDLLLELSTLEDLDAYIEWFCFDLDLPFDSDPEILDKALRESPFFTSEFMYVP